MICCFEIKVTKCWKWTVGFDSRNGSQSSCKSEKQRSISDCKVFERSRSVCNSSAKKEKFVGFWVLLNLRKFVKQQKNAALLISKNETQTFECIDFMLKSLNLFARIFSARFSLDNMQNKNLKIRAKNTKPNERKKTKHFHGRNPELEQETFSIPDRKSSVFRSSSRRLKLRSVRSSAFFSKFIFELEKFFQFVLFESTNLPLLTVASIVSFDLRTFVLCFEPKQRRKQWITFFRRNSSRLTSSIRAKADFSWWCRVFNSCSSSTHFLNREKRKILRLPKKIFNERFGTSCSVFGSFEFVFLIN